jgi:Protein of unknown function (DUF3124)
MRKFLINIFSLMLLGVAASAHAEEASLSTGETLYLPIYSHIWHGDTHPMKGAPMKAYMSALISIRNTSLKTPIKVISARYYNTDGKMLREFVSPAKTIGPMGTLELFIEKSESQGGSGANFIIQWEAESDTNAPIVEAVHIDNQANRPYSFVTHARVINKNK